jgi:hypothetical protein
VTTYYQKIYQADYEFESKNYEKAFEIYQSAFQTCPPINTPGYNERGKFAELCAVLGKEQLSLEFLEEKFKHGYELQWIQEDSVFARVLSSTKGKALIENYNNLREQHLTSINLELRDEIQQMQRSDQKYRGENYQDNLSKQDSIDSYNTNRLIEIFESVGYPTADIIGHYSVDRQPTIITAILLHTDDSIRMNYFVPKLSHFVRNGTCSPQTLGSVIDQFHLYNGEPQIYGTYQGANTKYADMIADLKQVDKNRISIGLPPLKLKEKKDSLNRIKYSYLNN